MLRIPIGIDPIIVQAGPLALRWYSLAIVVAIGIAVVVTEHEFRRRGISVTHYDAIVFWTVVGGLVGARLFFVIDHLGYMLQHPRQMVTINQGGLAIYGAVLGGFVAVALTCRIYHAPFRQVIDAVAPGLLLAQAFGRFGCIVNGDAWGAPTTHAPLAFVYSNPHALIPSDLLGVPTQPYPLYDMALNLAVFAVIWQLRKRDLPAGALFAWFAVLYAPGRFLITFVRQERIWFWGLQEAQVAALLTFLVGIVALVWLLRSRTAMQPAA